MATQIRDHKAPSRQGSLPGNSTLFAPRLAPLASAIAVLLVAGSAGNVHAQRAFSNAWYANMGAAQSTAATTGLLPNGTPASRLTNPQSQQQNSSVQMLRSLNNLNLAARSIAAQQAAQEAARMAALNGASGVPDGLTPGGLVVDTNNLTAGWINANKPTQTAEGGKTQVTIEQTAEKAILNWETFNVGKNTTVYFNQKGGNQADGTNNWIALNRINDPSGRPSEIAGQIKADGSVYLINRNGIIFTGSSQVNTRSLVASSLRLTDQQFNLGINNAQIMTSQSAEFPIPQFGEFTAQAPMPYSQVGAYVPGNGVVPDRLGEVDRFDPGLPPGEVTVSAGAQLGVSSGGKIMLFAPKVSNAGLLSAPDGQVILAAGENIYLKAPSAQDPNPVRGLDVAASAVPGWALNGSLVQGALGLSQVVFQYGAGVRDIVLPEMAARAKAVGYEVVNNGIVQSDRGNITLQAQDVRQNGVLLSTTALNNRNGSIQLRAWGLATRAYGSDLDDFYNWSAGTLTLGSGSVTQIMPDAADTSEIEASALGTRYQPGWIGMYGKLIDIKSQAGVLAPAGKINIEAAANPMLRALPGSLGDGSRIYLDSDAFLSVAGLRDMLVPMSRNFVEAELRINELRDSPLLLNSWLRGQKVIVDRREGGVFSDGPMAGVKWVQKKDANGQMVYMPGEWVGTPLADVAGWIGVGKTDLNELSADAGSIMLRAGGSVITRVGSMIDISGGSVRYSDGMNTATKLAGVDGGIYTMNKAMPDIEYAGLAGQFTQTHARWGVNTTWRSALIGGDFKEAGYTEGRKAGAVQVFAGDAMVLEGDMWGGVITGDRQQNKPVGKTGGQLVLGGGRVEDKPWSPGTVIVSHDPKRLGAAFNASSVLDADFYVPLDPANPRSEKLTLLSDDMLSNSGMGQTTFYVSKGDFEVAAGANVEFSPGSSLSVSGGENSTGAIRINGMIRSAGGSISLDSFYGQLEFGARGGLDVSGQWINTWRDGRSSGPWAVNGGAITLNAGKIMADENAVFDVSGGGRVDIGKKGLPALRVGDAGSIRLTGFTPDTGLASLNLRAYAAGSAGSLFLETPSSVQVGGASNDPAVVVLPANLFGDRGFGTVSVAVRGNGSIAVPDGVTVMQQAVGIDLDSFAYRDVASGTRLAGVAPIAVLSPQERLKRKPGGLTLGTEAGDIRVGAGASIVTDTGGKLALAAGGAGVLMVLGRLEVPAGRIDLSGKTVSLESGAQLLARGLPAIYLDKTGHLQGKVLSGGVVDIRAADLQLAAGSLIDVSGASGEIEQAQAGAGFGQVSYEKIGLASDGGAVNIRGEGQIAATLVGKPGGQSAQGGSLAIQHVAAGAGANLADELLKLFCQIDSSFCTPASVIGVDFALLLGYNPGDIAPMVITQTVFDHLGSASRASLVVSDKASSGGGQGGPGIDYAALGMSDEVVDLFRDQLYIDLRALTPASSLLVARPKSFSQGGFANLALASQGGSIELGDVQLSANRSITVDGTLRHAVGESGQASLAAAYIALKQTSSAIAPAATANRTGSLTLNADMIDVVGGVNGPGSTFGPASIRSFAKTALNASELRFSGNNAAVDPAIAADAATATLDVDGALAITAGLVYPTTAMNAKILSGESITVGRSGNSSVLPFSAGGTLRLEAPVIEQNGVLRAPFGQIELVAGNRLTLGAGSITSVSGAGLMVPYGTLLNNEHWKDPANAGDGVSASSGTLTSPPEKRITMKSPNVDLAKGAVIDISGGGDLYAWEFVPGPGGSNDLLTQPGMYAVMPGQQATAPVSGVDAGKRVWLAGGPGLAAGWYTLLPARYALLPGAFAVQATGNAWTGPAVPGIVNRDGSIIMQGKNSNAYGGSEDAQASAWRVMSGSTLRKYTEYNEAFANDFFSSEAFKLTQYRLTGQDIVTPRLARDGGAVVFEATTRLTLDGTLLSQADQGGRGGLVDIAGKKIAIVGASQDAGTLQTDGYLIIDAASLSNFGAGNLLVGGTRKGDLLGTQLDVTATDIVVRNGAGSELFGPEIILAAADKVAVDAGSIVSARGTGASSSGNLIMKPQQAAVYDNKGTPDTADDVLVTPAKDWGALIRVANGEAIKVVRQNVDTTLGGLVTIGASAVLSGGDALLIDATRTTELAASARISGTDLSVSAGRIGFGGGSGMVLDSAALAQLANSKHLTLRSYSSFDFHQSVDLGAAGLASLTFDGAAFTGHGGDIVIKGEKIALENSGANLVATGNGNGNFTLDAATLVLGAGQKNFAGFDAITLGGREQIVGAGKGGIDTGAIALNLNTALLTGRGGAAQSIVTTGALQVTAAPGNSTAQSTAQQNLQDSLGSRLSLSGASIVFGGRAVALGGNIDMTATAGSLVLADGAQIDVGGFAKQFFDVAGYADAGSIKLSAVGGDVRLNSGSQLNLAAHKDGGNAGALNVAAANGGTVVLDGTINAQAGAGGKAGAFSLDIAALADFAGFSQRLNDAGFNRSRQFRIRQGDITLDGNTTVEDFGLTTDQGNITIAGTVDARAAYGGTIRITGGNGVTMNAGAQLLAGATGELGSGRVTLEAAGGQLNLQGGTINVAGNEGGKVRLRAQQNAAHNDLNASAVNVSIAGARSAVLEGVATYNSSTVDAVKAAAIADASQFSAAAAAVANRLGTTLAVMPGIVIESAGDLTMNSDWNLRGDFANAREGTLTLRAGGNLVVKGHLSDGFDTADRAGKLQEGASWNLRLVAGADLDSANTLAVKPLAAQIAGSGSITIGTADTNPDAAIDNGSGKLVRTGTGDLEVRAGRDLTLAHKESVIYTAGRKDITAWSDFTTANAAAIYGIEGGNLDIAAQGSIEAQPAGQRFVEWLNRQGNLITQGYFGEYESQTLGTRPDGSYGYLSLPPEQSSWWINYGAFKQGVGALGGGNVTVNAGGDLGNLVVVVPTTMRMRGGRSAAEAMAMEVRNGGSLTVEAGGAIRGGQYYVARGAGDIKAGETAVGNTVSVIWNEGAPDSRTYTFPVAPVLALGDATLNVRTAGDLRVQTVVDPLLVRYGDDGSGAGTLPKLEYGAYMSGYTDRTALKLVSTGGNITFVNQADFIFHDLSLRLSNTAQDNLIGQGGNRFPARTAALAMNGNLEIQGPLRLMAGTTNDVQLVAQGDIRFATQNRVTLNAMNINTDLEAQVAMPYATAAMMPSAFKPGGLAFSRMETLLANEITSFTTDPTRNPDVLSLANDFEPSRIYAGHGSILGLDLTANEQTWVRAATDIRGMRVNARNVRASDVTLLEAGNDILAMGNVRAATLSQPYNTGSIVVQGPGTLVLSAGRDVYADNLKIQTLGNQSYNDVDNRPLAGTQIKGLPSQGASITVMAGMNGAAAYDAFAGAYLDPSKAGTMPDYLKTRAADGSVLPIYLTDSVETRAGDQQKVTRRGLVSYMKDMTGQDLAPSDAWTRFQSLPPLAQQQFLRQVYLLELREAGRNQGEPGVNGLPLNGGYNRGYAAIATLFPGEAWKGNVAANNMMLRTMSGGDINVLTPGGGLQVASLGAVVPAGYGLVTLGSGHINVSAKDDVVVNQSRILSFVPEASKRGSDQIIWSSRGGIDAGRGSKTVRVPSAPEIVTDLDGNTIVREKSDMSGSGIGTVGDGDVDLVAPQGTINAGDAGIRVAGNLNIMALQVLNADNIKVKGDAKGLPVVESVNIGTLTNAGAATSQAAMAAQDVMQRERAAARQNLPSVFTVRVIGFGNEPMEGGSSGARRESSQPVSASPQGVVEVLGQMDLPPSQMELLTATERRNLKR